MSVKPGAPARPLSPLCRGPLTDRVTSESARIASLVFGRHPWSLAYRLHGMAAPPPLAACQPLMIAKLWVSVCEWREPIVATTLAL